MTPQEFLLQSEDEIALELAQEARQLRVGKNITQEEFSIRSGIPFATYGKFERTGQISLVSFLKVLRHLGRLKNMSTLLASDDVERVGIRGVLDNKKSTNNIYRAGKKEKK